MTPAADLTVTTAYAPWLPENWLPAALCLMTGAAGGDRRVFLHDPAAPGQGEAVDLPAKVIADPVALSEALAKPMEGRFLGWIGPEGSASQAFGGAGVTLPADKAASALVLIDQGVAVWNPALRSAGASRFAGLVFLPPWGQPGPGNLIDRAGIADLCALADAGRMDDLLARLAAAGPDSLYAANPVLAHAWPDAVWHGSAVAGAALGGARDVAAYAIELPDSAAGDWTGGILQALLPQAVQAALQMTEAMADRPLTIVLPYGFTGSPLDGAHPAARVLAGQLAQAQAAGRQVRMVLPTGNHRQDACCAQTDGRALPWHIPPDDFSANAIDLSAEDDPAEVVLALPGGETVALPLERGEVGLIHLRGQLIAAAARPVAAGWRLRLALMPTGAAQVAAPRAPFGLWRIATGGTPIAAIVLRDDRDPLREGAAPRRQSWLVDWDQPEHGPDGGALLTDPPGAVVTRRGTLSVLASTAGATAVGAQARWDGVTRVAAYAGLSATGTEAATQALVDDGWPDCGIPALAGGWPRWLRLSGTSLAAGLVA